MQPIAKKHRQKELGADLLFNVTVIVITLVTLGIVLYPLYLIIICSFSDPALVASGKVMRFMPAAR